MKLLFTAGGALLGLSLAAVGAVEADVGPRSLIALRVRVDRVVAGPLVVSLPGLVRRLENNVGGAAVVANDERDDIFTLDSIDAR